MPKKKEKMVKIKIELGKCCYTCINSDPGVQYCKPNETYCIPLEKYISRYQACNIYEPLEDMKL